MSFSGKVKEELAGQFSPARHCQVAELAALLCGCGRVEKMSDGNRKLWIQTENEAVARKSFTLLRKTFNIETAIVIREGSHLKRGKVYLVEVTDPARTEEVLQGTKLSVDNEKVFSYIVELTKEIKKNNLEPNRIVWEDNSMDLYFENVCVRLGRSRFDEKVVQLPPILEKLEGKTGVLDMEYYNEASSDISFKEEVTTNE